VPYLLEAIENKLVFTEGRARALSAAARAERHRPAAATDPAAAKSADGEVTDSDIAELAEETGASFDPDARWGYRTYDNRTNKLFGYKLVSLTRLATVGSKADLPMLVERIAFMPANASPVGPALDAIDRLRGDGIKVTEIAGDRGFS
jgi:hypothetical protein